MKDKKSVEDKKLVKKIESCSNSFCKKLDKLKKRFDDTSNIMFDRISEIEEFCHESGLSADLDKSTLSKEEKLRLKRMLDKAYNSIYALWGYMIKENYAGYNGCDFEYLKDLKILVENSKIKKNKKRELIKNLEKGINLEKDINLEKGINYNLGNGEFFIEYEIREKVQEELYDHGIDYNEFTTEAALYRQKYREKYEKPTMMGKVIILVHKILTSMINFLDNCRIKWNI